MELKEHRQANDESWHLHQIVHCSPALLHTARPDGSLDFFNQTWLDFSGETLEKLRDWGWTSCIHPEDVESLVSRMRESFARGVAFQETSRVRRADGQYRWMLHLKVPLRDSTGTIVMWHGSSVDIEEQVRSEEELRRSAQELALSEFYLSEAQRLGHIGGWVFDPEAGFTYWSRELFLIHGLDPAGTAPTTEEYIKLLHPQDRDSVATLMRRVPTDPAGFDLTKRIVRPNGDVRYLRCVGSPATTRDGAKRMGVGIDVTDHEFLTRELIRREAYSAEAQRLSRTGSLGWKPESGAITWSTETYRIFEIDPATPITLSSIFSRVHPEDLTLVHAVIENASTVREPIDLKHRLLFPDGRIKFVQVLARPLEIGSDGLEFTGAVIDITEATQAEERIRESEFEFRQLIDAIPQQVAVFSPHWNPLFSNRQAEIYTGLKSEDLQSISMIDGLVHPDDIDLVHRTREHATREHVLVEVEARMRRRDGVYRWFLLRAYPMLDAQKNLVRWYATRTDIDERRRAEDHLRDARMKLAKASRIATVAELSASIAHELNQPLMSIFASAQAAKRWMAAGSSNLQEVEAAIERILRDARAADETMQHIRALFKREPVDKRETNISAMIKEAVRFVQEDPKRKETSIDSQIDEHLPALSVDMIQIQQVFINLLANAIEALEGSAVPPAIQIKATRTEHDEILVQVIDNGPGVADPETIFDAFVTTKEKGMGIGLAVSRSIIEAHGGKLWAENQSDGGAKFNLTLPLVVSNQDSSGN